MMTLALWLATASQVAATGCGSSTSPPGTTGNALTFQGDFAGDQETPASASAATGSVQLNLDATHTMLTYTLMHNLMTPTAAHIHKGALGVAGPVVFPLMTTNGATGTLQLTPDQAADLMAGNDYVNIHSADLPDGEIRTQAFPAASPTVSTMTQFSAQLTGLQELLPLSSTASGTADLTLNEQTGTLTYTIHHTLATGTTVNLLQGNLNATGTVVAALMVANGGALSLQLSGTLTLSADQMLQLKSGLMYMEIQSVAHVAGELRGQILPSLGGKPAMPFNVALMAVPLVTTTASGTAHFVLSPDQTQLTYRLEHTAQAVSGATIIKAPLGVGTTAVCTLSNANNQGQGTCAVKAQGSASDLLLSDLQAGSLYVMIQTQAHVMGELRGQLMLPKSM